MDTLALEKERGITIFSKQARLNLGDKAVTLLDTPGHEDFGAEMERTLMVLDYAILVISGADGIRGHDETLWKLLERYHIPTFLLINKMDQRGTDRDALFRQISEKFGSHCVDFSGANFFDGDFCDAPLFEDGKERVLSGRNCGGDFLEALALCDEDMLDNYLETGQVMLGDVIRLIKKRRLFPCYFGSALKQEGIREFIAGLSVLTQSPGYPEEFGARVYKISRDEKGTRLTHLKVTGGTLKVKMAIDTGGDAPEKADQLRVYSGASFKMENQIRAGDICAVAGPVHTRAGQGLGIEAENSHPLVEPVLTYHIRIPENIPVPEMLARLRELEEEIPELHIVWNESAREIHAQAMGQVQLEILKSLIRQRYNVDVDFDSGSIVYKETIASPAEGVGHFEPLRHYAEVHLLLEPLPKGSGLVFDTACPEDTLDKNWQRLILTHLEEKRHVGVLTGSEITDMKITLMSGRAHLKHTEGGDFRQATYRAVRQGLKSAQSVLLEPVYAFTLEVPGENTGRALADIQKMNGNFDPPQTLGEMTCITGTAPVALMREYYSQVLVYTKGRGRLVCQVAGYEPCHNAREVIEASGYDSEADTDNPTGSVFCSHGAGFYVPWDQVPRYMHLPSCLEKNQREAAGEVAPVPKNVADISWDDEKELEEIFVRTYGPIRKEKRGESRGGGGKVKVFGDKTGSPKKKNGKGMSDNPQEYLLVDGYNIIFAWDDLNDLSKSHMDSARTKLADILCDYQGCRKNTVILVFDAYRVEGHPGEILQYKNIYIVYTKEAETADQYIEKTVHEIGKKHHVTVATSDGTEQVIILGQGARRLSARGLLEEILEAKREIRELYMDKRGMSGQNLFENLPEHMARMMEDVRLGYSRLSDSRERSDKQ